MSIRSEEQESSYELHVARDSTEENHGIFISSVLQAFEHADPQNFELMRPFVRALIRKYDIKCSQACQRDGTGWTAPIPKWVTVWELYLRCHDCAFVTINLDDAFAHGVPTHTEDPDHCSFYVNTREEVEAAKA